MLGQNLIPNPSFEDTVNGSFGIKLAKDWSFPTSTRSEYYTNFHNQQRPDWGIPQNLIGNQYANTGGAYVGLRMYPLDTFVSAGTDINRRDYIQSRIKRVLKMDSTYCLQLYVSLADSSHFASKGQLGIYFSSVKVDTITEHYLPYKPQVVVSPITYISDKNEWLEFNFQYTADGTEEYMIIGNFNDSSKIDTSFVGGGNQFWQETTYYYIDDIYLGHCDSVPDTLTTVFESNFGSEVCFYPNPVKERFYVKVDSDERLRFQLYNLLGQPIEVSLNQSGSRYEFEMEYLPKGVYLLEVVDGYRRNTFKILKE